MRVVANCRLHSPGKHSDDVFLAISLCRPEAPNAPILSTCAARFPTRSAGAHSNDAREGTRLLESLRFPAFVAPASGPASRAIAAQAIRTIAAKRSPAGTRRRACVDGPPGADR